MTSATCRVTAGGKCSSAAGTEEDKLGQHRQQSSSELFQRLWQVIRLQRQHFASSQGAATVCAGPSVLRSFSNDIIAGQQPALLHAIAKSHVDVLLR